ncbi:O-antigen ligase family protein [Cupriavidus basilensis]|uniref:O-antigen ligase family protein n=1 Tax=Cupriavidus basilensis TaxID=68895 RepID=A0ABT6B446_9BURK|nr:O-antigen ligase family protein [Cupriavidus basilensis]MDF3839484.1 O-antigen ligase family protein [Cupriavidus basilensis]
MNAAVTVEPGHAGTGRQLQPAALPVCFLALMLGLALLGQGRAIDVLFPLGAVGIGIHIYRRNPAHYLSYLLWLFFLTPEVRRIADFINGSYSPFSPIQTAPLIVAMLSGLTLLTHVRVLATRRAFPTVLILLALCYGLAIGIMRNGPLSALYSFVGWTMPILVGFHVLATWRSYPGYARSLVVTFTWGLIVTGVYAFIQFALVPPWDVFWMLHAGMGSLGEPIPYAIRVSSTMNSAGPFAVMLMGGLLFMLAGRGKLVWLAALIGLVALLLTVVRSCWGGLLVGAIYALACIERKLRIRVLLGALLVAALAVPVFALQEFSGTVLTSMQSVADLQNDHSFQTRAEFYGNFLSVALNDISGQGFGSVGLATKLDSSTSQLGRYGVFDSGLMEVPFVLGWPGTLMYATGLLWLLGRAVRRGLTQKSNRVISAGVGVAIALLAMMVFDNSLNGFGGLLFQLGVMLPVIGHRYGRMVATRGAS